VELNMKLTTVIAATAVCLLYSSAAPLAHHSAAVEFDEKKPIKVTGTLTKVDWVNPHTIFYMDVTDSAGNKATWGWELPSPNQLMRAGWSRTSMKVGDTIGVEGIHARDGSNHGMAMVVTLASTGKRLFAGQAEP
jgi:hypothetical protein